MILPTCGCQGSTGPLPYTGTSGGPAERSCAPNRAWRLPPPTLFPWPTLASPALPKQSLFFLVCPSLSGERTLLLPSGLGIRLYCGFLFLVGLSYCCFVIFCYNALIFSTSSQGLWCTGWNFKNKIMLIMPWRSADAGSLRMTAL